MNDLQCAREIEHLVPALFVPVTGVHECIGLEIIGPECIGVKIRRGILRDLSLSEG